MRRMSELMLEVDALEGKLQDASKQRESRLRKVRGMAVASMGRVVARVQLACCPDCYSKPV